MLAALSHSLRRRILRTFESGEEVSPVQLAKALDSPISEITYHLGVLVKAGAVEPSGAKNKRGARRQLYGLTLDGGAEWVRGVLEASRESDDGSRA
jgi:DNA-binding transcriptional ArsR family regulator